MTLNTKNRIVEKATDNPSHGGLEIKSEFVRCDLCGSEDHEIVYAKIDPVTKWEFYLVRCSCGMAFVNPMPLGESLKLLYPGHYLDEKPGLDSLYQKMISILESVNVGNRLLDIGCGSGEFIRYANERGWDAHGVDFVDWATDKNNLKIRVGHLPSMSIPESSFDVVTAWAVMEHVRDPSSYFEKIGILLRKQGKFVFTVPNVSSPGMIYSCDEDTPRHLWLFTPEPVA